MTEAGGPRGYDAVKKIKGRKRDAMVNTNVLDWEAARLSDPLWDVAFNCHMFPFYYHNASSNVQSRERETFLGLYRNATERSLEDLDYWEALVAPCSAVRTAHPAFASNWSPIYWEQVKLLLGS